LIDGEFPREMMEQLVAARRAGSVNIDVWVAAERLPEILAIPPQPVRFSAPPSREREWTREAAIVELLRGRLSIVGPATITELAASFKIAEKEIEVALLSLEAEGVVLRTGGNWCDRRLLARIHRYTLNRLRAEIEPVTAADFTRFLFAWQHVSSRLSGIDGLPRIVQQLDGCEVTATAWEKFVLPSRMDRY